MFHTSRLIPYHFIPVVHSFSVHHGENYQQQLE